jgi:hypothetical protein
VFADEVRTAAPQPGSRRLLGLNVLELPLRAATSLLWYSCRSILPDEPVLDGPVPRGVSSSMSLSGGAGPVEPSSLYLASAASLSGSVFLQNVRK